MLKVIFSGIFELKLKLLQGLSQYLYILVTWHDRKKRSVKRDAQITRSKATRRTTRAKREHNESSKARPRRVAACARGASALRASNKASLCHLGFFGRGASRLVILVGPLRGWGHRGYRVYMNHDKLVEFC